MTIPRPCSTATCDAATRLATRWTLRETGGDLLRVRGPERPICRACRAVLMQYATEAQEARTLRAAALLGQRGGQARTEAKVQAARANGRLGGRPRKAKE